MLITNFDDGLNAVVVGASGAIGSSFVQQLCFESSVKNVSAFSRGEFKFRHPKLDKYFIDLENEESIEYAARLTGMGSKIDLLLVTAGLLHRQQQVVPEKNLRMINAAMMEEVFRVNTIGPALIAKHFVPLFNKKRKSVLAFLSARVGSISDNHLGGWYAYRASKAALNMLIKNISIEAQRTHPQLIVAGLHPGTVDSNLSKPFQANVPEGKLFSSNQSTSYMLAVINGLEQNDSGAVFAWDGSKVEF